MLTRVLSADAPAAFPQGLVEIREELWLLLTWTASRMLRLLLSLKVCSFTEYFFSIVHWAILILFGCITVFSFFFPRKFTWLKIRATVLKAPGSLSAPSGAIFSRWVSIALMEIDLLRMERNWCISRIRTRARKYFSAVKTRTRTIHISLTRRFTLDGSMGFLIAGLVKYRSKTSHFQRFRLGN